MGNLVDTKSASWAVSDGLWVRVGKKTFAKVVVKNGKVSAVEVCGSALLKYKNSKIPMDMIVSPGVTWVGEMLVFTGEFMEFHFG